jgi:transposase
MSQHLSVTLTDAQREYLARFTRSGVAAARQQIRARILLLADKSPGHGYTQKQIAQALQVCEPTVCAICRRFALEGMEAALTEKPRPGALPKITGEVEAQLVLLACSDPPEGFARWTMQLLADKLIEMEWVESISDSTVCQRLKKRT